MDNKPSTGVGEGENGTKLCSSAEGCIGYLILQCFSIIIRCGIDRRNGVQSTDRSIYSLRFVSNYKNFNVDKYKKKYQQ
jgi:hypothetical protein